jgi:uracil-DNA glycosylase
VNESKRRAWQALGIGPAWRLRETGLHNASESPAQTPPGEMQVDDPDPGGLDWPNLRGAVTQCRACGLCEGRQQAVFGVGDESAGWMVIGEAPGAEEDRRGEPFVGRAGQLLDAMLSAVGRNRRDGVFITNVLKCRPPGNRNPEPQEVARCLPYLRRQIELVSPGLILALGKFAAQALLDTDASIASLRGRVHHYRSGALDIPVVVTYHPAYLLRTPLDKAKAWEDLVLALRNDSVPLPADE